MGTFSLMTLGRQAASVAYTQLQVTGNNIANANTPGYSRQSAQLATAGSSTFNGSGYLGRGVTVSTVARASNMYLSGQVVATASAAAADGVRRDMLSQLEQVFAGGEAGLGQAATQIFNAFADVAAAPTDLSARQAVLGRLEDFATLSRASSLQIEVLQANLKNDVLGGVDEVNTLAAELAKLNLGIVAAAGGGQRPNELLDQRDQLIKRIGQQVQVQTYISADETANVFVGSGQTLVQGSHANALVALPDLADPDRMAVGVKTGARVVPLDNAAVGDGMIGGLLRFQDSDLADARNRLDQLVIGLADALNTRQSLGRDLLNNAGRPLFDYTGRGQAMAGVPAADNARDGGGALIGAVSVTVADASALKASEYRLQADPAGASFYRLTRLSDGQRFEPVSDGQTIDGFTLQVGANAPAPGDSFRFRPVEGAAANLGALVKNPRLLAAANPVTATVGASNAGTVGIAALAIEALPAAGNYSALTVRFTDDTGGYEILDVDAGNAVVGSGRFDGSQPLSHDGIVLKLTGVPRQDDTLRIAPAAFPGSSNGNALRFDGLASRLLVDGQTVTDAYANAMSEVGVRVQGANASADTSATVAARATAEMAGATGVNLDEEAARLIQFQQSYQAAAKVMQTAQLLLDTIINLAR